MTERIVVAVSQNAVVQAESAILGCSECALEASVPFWQVVDKLRNSASLAPAGAVYILPVLASCPNCRAPIDETTLVTPAVFEPRSPVQILAQTRA
jgi:hypothetical protein